jgi:hypothetical protein
MIAVPKVCRRSFGTFQIDAAGLGLQLPLVTASAGILARRTAFIPPSTAQPIRFGMEQRVQRLFDRAADHLAQMITNPGVFDLSPATSGSRHSSVAPSYRRSRQSRKCERFCTLSIPVPKLEIIVHRALRRQVFQRRVPLAPSPERVEIPFRTSRTFADPCGRVARRRDHRCDKCPFGIGQIARITNAVAVRSTAMFGCPNGALPRESSAQQGITSDSSDSRTSRIGSKVFDCIIVRVGHGA